MNNQIIIREGCQTLENDRVQVARAVDVGNWERLPINPVVPDVTLWDLVQRPDDGWWLRVAIGYTSDGCSIVSGERYFMGDAGAYLPCPGGRTSDADTVLVWLK